MKKIAYLKKQLNCLNSKINVFLLLFFILLSNSVYSLKLFAVFSGVLYAVVLNYPIKINKSKIWDVLKGDKTVWFYFSMISIGIVNLILNFSYNYMIVVFVGIFLWLINIVIHRETFFFIKSNSYEKILNTLKVFVVLNFTLSVINLIQVMSETGSLIPYTQMVPPPYGGMSGDFIRGFFMNEHLPNSCISTLLFFYFLVIKQYRIALISLSTLLLASSSLCLILVILFFIPLFILNDKKMKYFIVLSFVGILIFYIKINPFNYYEILNALKITDKNKFGENLMEQALSDQSELDIRKKNIDSLIVKWKSERVDKDLTSNRFINNRGKNSQNKRSANKSNSYTSNLKKNSQKTDSNNKESSNKNNNPQNNTKVEEIDKNQQRQEFYSNKDSLNKEAITEQKEQLSTYAVSDIRKVESYSEDISKNHKLYVLQQKKDSLDKEVLKKKFDLLWDKRKESINESNENEYFEYGKLKYFDIEATPGMLISLHQTKEFLMRSNKNMILGNGMGNFSSILAYTSSKEGGSSRLLKMVLPEYEHKDFVENHKALWKYVYYKGSEYHSVKNYPYNTYNTLLGEYGILGMLSFLMLFVLPIVLKVKRDVNLLIILIPLFMTLMGMFYWFEGFTFILFFEIIIYNEIRENASHENN